MISVLTQLPYCEAEINSSETKRLTAAWVFLKADDEANVQNLQSCMVRSCCFRF